MGDAPAIRGRRTDQSLEGVRIAAPRFLTRATTIVPTDRPQLLAHVRALNARYADDQPVTVTPQYVSRLMLDAGDPRSEYWHLMRNETIPADSLSQTGCRGWRWR